MKNPLEKLIEALSKDRTLRKWALNWARKQDKCTKGEVTELFNEALGLLWIELDKGKEITNPESYFRSIFRNLWIRKAKKERKTREKLSQLPPSENVFDLAESLTQQELFKIMKEEIDKMDVTCHTILTLFYLDELNQKTIAQKLGAGWDELKVKRKAYRCRQSLKKRLLNYPEFKDL